MASSSRCRHGPPHAPAAARLTLLLAVICLPERASGQPAVAATAPSRCQKAEFTADLGSCTASRCTLMGNVHLKCEDLQVWADHMEILLTPGTDPKIDSGLAAGPAEAGEFAGASASGNVKLVDKSHNIVLTCAEVDLAEDRIRGHVLGATVHISIRHADGRLDQAVITGDAERIDEERLIVERGSFTLCDCDTSPPPWRLESSRIDVLTKSRATLYWPMIVIDPLENGGFPITPPLLPLSIPLRSRAPGSLLPRIEILDGSPQFDQPFFMPIGPAWDVTLSPGYRWSWSALRLGGRVRYAPASHTSGEFSGQYTYDWKKGAARAYRDLRQIDGGTQEFDCGSRAEEKQFCRLAALRHRLALSWKHRSETTPSRYGQTRYRHSIDWVSDDRYKIDFAARLEETAADTISSRAGILHLANVGHVRADLDYLLRLGNDPQEWRNTRGKELRAPQRLNVQMETLPLFLGEQAQASAGVYFRRLGPWFAADAPPTTVAHAEAGLGGQHNFGPVATAASVLALAGSVLQPGNDTPRQGASQWAALVQASATLPLVRRYDAGGTSYTHLLSPRLAYKGLPWLRQAGDSGTLRRDLAAVDERWLIRQHHHLALAVTQQLLLGDGLHQVAQWDIEVPLRLAAGELGPLRNSMALHLDKLDLTINTSIALPLSAAQRGRTLFESIQFAQATISLRPASFFSLALNYTYLSPFAEGVFLRRDGLLGDRQFTAEVNDTGAAPANWVHDLTPTLRLRIAGDRLDLSYSALLRLPRPGEEEVQDSDGRQLIYQHNLSVNFGSTCKCWSIGLRAAIPGRGAESATPKFSEWSLGFLFSVGGFKIGSR